MTFIKPNTVCYAVLILSLLILCSCARIGEYAKERADKAAYEIIEKKQMEALGELADFNIDDEMDPVTAWIYTEAPDIGYAREGYTSPSFLLSLGETMAVAVSNNRDYKSQRESLYSQALSLTEVRRNFHYLFDASANASLSRTEFENGDETVEWFGSRGLSAGVSKLFATGARMTLDFSHSFTRYLSNDPRPGASNSLAFAITQPLLRGAGAFTVREGLRQSERSMIYSVRSFRRYQQEFIITVASQYFNLLDYNNQLRNAQLNYQSTLDNLNKLERLSEGGRVTSLDVDQARQAVLEAEIRLVRIQLDYARRLDELKIFLGIPMTLDIGPDPQQLVSIAERGLLRPDMTLKQAMDIALEERLDYKTQMDQIDDAVRQVKISLRNFLPNLDVGYNFSTTDSAEKDRIRFDFENNDQRWYISLGIPFDWTPRRNAFRNSLISLEQSRRNLELFRENLILEVRDAWRALEESRTDYRIQLESVRIAERRVRRASLFLESGRATARDLLEAEEALLQSRNALSSALVRHTIERMRFWNTIERFEIDEHGLWTDLDEISPVNNITYQGTN